MKNRPLNKENITEIHKVQITEFWTNHDAITLNWRLQIYEVP